METQEFKPSIGGIIATKLSAYLLGFGITILGALIGMAMFFEDSDNFPPIMVPIIFGVPLLIAIFFSGKSVKQILINDEGVAVDFKGKVQTFAYSDYYISSETFTNYVYFIPFQVTRTIFFEHVSGQEDMISFNCRGIGRKQVGEMINLIDRYRSQQEVRNDVVADVLTDEVAMEQAVNLGAVSIELTKVAVNRKEAIIMLIGGPVMAMIGLMMLSLFVLIVGIVIFFMGIYRIVAGDRKRANDTITTFEVNEQTINVTTPKGVEQFPINEVGGIQFTPIGYNEKRVVKFVMNNGAGINFYFGTGLSANNKKYNEINRECDDVYSQMINMSRQVLGEKVKLMIR